MPVIFDPEAKNTVILEDVPSRMDVTKVARIRARTIVERRKIAGETKPHIVPVVHRTTGEMRWFNIGSVNTKDTNYAIDGDVSWVISAEALINGHWRLASKQEEISELARQKEVSKEAIKKAFNYEIMAGGARVASMASDARFQHLVDKAAAIAEEEKQEAAKKTAKKDEKDKKEPS